VLIDAEGKVTFYKAGYEITELQAAIAKLPGPSILALQLLVGTIEMRAARCWFVICTLARMNSCSTIASRDLGIYMRRRDLRSPR
jgi:hypothetical protein